MNNVTMTSRQGLGSSRNTASTYGKQKKRPQSLTSLSEENGDGTLNASSTSNQALDPTVKLNRPIASGSKLVPIGKPRHQLVRRPLNKPTTSRRGPPLDAYSFGSDDDTAKPLKQSKQSKPSKPSKPRPTADAKSKPMSKPSKPLKSPALLSTASSPGRAHADRPKLPAVKSTRRSNQPSNTLSPSLLPPSSGPDLDLGPGSGSSLGSGSDSDSEMTPKARIIAKPSRPSTLPKHAKKPSLVSPLQVPETPRPAKRPCPPPSSPPTVIHHQKRRLIDELAAQADSDPDDSSDESSDSSDGKPSIAVGAGNKEASPSQNEYSPQTQTNPRREPWARRTPQNKPPGVKYTYSSQRSLLSESSSLSASGTGTQDALDIFAMAAPSAPSFDYEEDDLESSQTGGIRTLHELRQAGASSRFTDEMEDLLDRVGTVEAKASSMRRSALIELVDKLKDKSFRRQFRDFGGDARLFSSAERETDIIAAVAMVCVFLSLLAAGKATHITHKMHAKTLVNMLFPLLDVADDLTTLARQRKSNLSRHGQTTFGSLGVSINKLPIWDSMEPRVITPQILALKCLDLTIEQVSDQALEGLVSSLVSDKLFGILSESMAEAEAEAETEAEERQDNVSLPVAEASPSSPPSQELFLALTVLKICSVKAMESGERRKWTNQHLPLVVKALQSCLGRTSTVDGSKTRSLVSQVTINMTNNNTEAAGVVSTGDVLEPILSKLRDELGSVSTSGHSSSFSSDALDNLVLLLGVMINFCEHSPLVRELVIKSDTLEGLIRPLLVHYKKRSEADSVDKTQANVALGYLSVLLIYLCQHEPARVKFKAIGGGGTLEPLFVSLREFMALNNAVEKQAGRVSSEFAQRIGTLVAQLEQEERRRNR